MFASQRFGEIEGCNPASLTFRGHAFDADWTIGQHRPVPFSFQDQLDRFAAVSFGLRSDRFTRNVLGQASDSNVDRLGEAVAAVNCHRNLERFVGWQHEVISRKRQAEVRSLFDVEAIDEVEPAVSVQITDDDAILAIGGRIERELRVALSSSIVDFRQLLAGAIPDRQVWVPGKSQRAPLDGDVQL